MTFFICWLLYFVWQTLPRHLMNKYMILLRPRCARFVGYASNNKASWHLPWHRVVFKDGSLCCGFAAQQYAELKSEGVKFTPEKTVVMSDYQWDPERDGVPMDIRDFPLVF